MIERFLIIVSSVILGAIVGSILVVLTASYFVKPYIEPGPSIGGGLGVLIMVLLIGAILGGGIGLTGSLIFVSVESSKSAIEEKSLALVEEVKKGNINSLKQLLSEGVDLNREYDYGWTVLMWSALSGNSEMVKILIS